MHDYYDVIEIDNYVILKTLHICILENILFLSINLDLKHAKPNIGKVCWTNIILITKYLILNWKIVISK